MKAGVDVYGIGNALVDLVHRVDDDFLKQYNVTKAQMTLVDVARMSELRDQLVGNAESQSCGGSAANTVFAIRGLGCSAFYSSRVASDENGLFFMRDMNEAGIGTSGINDLNDAETGQCLVLVTEDGERTLNTHVGIASSFSAEQINEAVLSTSSYLYIEGYLAASQSSQSAARHAREVADAHRVKTTLSLSDRSIVSGFKDAVVDILGNGVDHIFCNADEAMMWCRTDRLDVAFNELCDIAPSVSITYGSEGAETRSPQGVFKAIPPQVTAVDTNGAGDLFAGAYLAVLVEDATAQREATAFATRTAAAIVQHYGPRLQNLAAYAELKNHSMTT